MAGVYISHRDRASGYAGRIREALVERFGHGYIRMDEPSAVLGCEVMTVLIDRRWLDHERAIAARPPAPEDPPQLEVVVALQAGLLLIPVLLQDATMPDPTELPEAIAGITRRQPLVMREDTWRHDIDRLAELLAAAPPGREPILARNAQYVARLRTIGGEASYISAVAFAEEGIVVSGAVDGTTRFHRVSDGKLIRSIDAHSERITSMAVAAGRLATASTDGMLRVWRLTDGELDAELRTAAPFAFRLHRRVTKNIGDAAFSVALAPDGGTVAWGNAEGRLQLARLGELPPRPARAHIGRVAAVAFSADGGLAASAGWDGRIVIWNPADGRRTADMSTPERIQIWEANAKRLRPEMLGHLMPSWWINDLAFAGRDTVLACAAGQGRVQLWDPVAGEQMAWWSAHDPTALAGRFGASEGVGLGGPPIGGATCVAFGPDDELLASGGEDARLRLWRTSNGACVADLAGPSAGITDVAFSPTGRLLACSSWDGSVSIFGVTAA